MAFLDYFSIDYANKIIRHTSGTSIYTTQTMYSELQDLFDALNQMDDQVPLSAQTPTQFTMINEWFIDSASLQYIRGGALQTSGWSGKIVAISYNASCAGTMFEANDRGETITGTTTGDTGKILGWDERYGSEIGVVYIRPDDAGDLFDNNGEAWTVSNSVAAGNFTATFHSAGGATGENVWSQYQTLGTLHAQVVGTPDTKIYALQDTSAVGGSLGPIPEHASATETNTALGSFGQIDILVPTREVGKTIDNGRVQFFARKEGTLYDNFEASSVGGNSVIAFATATDINNTDGTRLLNCSAGDAAFTLGEVITQSGLVKGYIRAINGTQADPDLDIMQLGNLNVTTGAIQGVSSGANATVDTVSSIGAAVAPQSDVTINFGRISRDLNNGAGAKNYSIEIDASGELIEDVYEVLQYRMRRGETTDIDLGANLGIPGQEYKGIEVRLDYNTATGNAVVGEVITGGTSLAKGIIASATASGATGYVMVTALNGTFQTAEQITTATLTAANCTAVTSVQSPKAAPFGTFAGGKFFGARGVYVTNIATADTQNFSLVDDDNATQNPPNTVPVTITSLVAGDAVFVAQRDTNGTVLKLPSQTAVGGDLKHSTFNLAANTVGATSLVIADDGNGNTAIQLDNPDGLNTLRAAVRVLDTGLAVEDRYRYSSFSGATFTLTAVTNATGALAATSDSTTMVGSGTAWNTGGEPVLVGDIVRNITAGGISYVSAVNSDTNLSIFPPIAGQASGDSFEINRLVRSYATDDDAYVPFLDRIAVSTAETNNIIQSSGISVLIRVRDSGATPIIPYEATGTIGSTGLSSPAIRTVDSNAT